MDPVRATATPTWTALHGGFRGVSADGQREYFVQPSGVPGWWAVTGSVDVTMRKLVGSREGAIRVAENWEATGR
jgi:hypothetical protein